MSKSITGKIKVVTPTRNNSISLNKASIRSLCKKKQKLLKTESSLIFCVSKKSLLEKSKLYQHEIIIVQTKHLF